MKRELGFVPLAMPDEVFAPLPEDEAATWTGDAVPVDDLSRSAETFEDLDDPA